MALQMENKKIETESLVGAAQAQALARAEVLVPGAGREAIEPLLTDARLVVSGVDLQQDRLVIDCAVHCQAVYRQGEETSLRALTAQASLSHVLEIPGAQPGMLCRVRGEANHVDAHYENGHMVFLASCALRAQVLSLSPQQVITDISGEAGLQTAYREVRSVKLAAESEAEVQLKDDVALPAGLDARMVLMDWAGIELESVLPDLGGVRVKGRVQVETLVSSGVPGRPAVTVRYPMAFDQLVELPEWLCKDVYAEAAIRSLRSELRPAEGEGGEVRLANEADVELRIIANTTDSAEALSDVYATHGCALMPEMQTLNLCDAARQSRTTDSVRGTVLIGENAPGVGTILAVLVHPNIAQWHSEGEEGRIEGIFEVRVLYLPGGSDQPAATDAELPFSLSVPVGLTEDSLIDIQVISAEANALMSDRLEIKLQLSVSCETRSREQLQIVSGVEEGEPLQRRPGIILVWPLADEDAWSLGKRYAVPSTSISSPEPGKPLILKQRQ